MANVLKTEKQIAVIAALVEVFDIPDHSETNRVFAWSFETDDDRPTQHVTVLQIPPATTPENAVRAASVSEFRK